MSQPLASPAALARVGARRPSAASRWIDARLTDAARAMASISDSLRRRRRFVFVEQPDGSFLPAAKARRPAPPMQWRDGGFAGAPKWRGGEVEFRLAAQRFVFRELELPDRAREFLEGVVRAQIDRITPWRAAEAAFGWAAPEPRPGGRIAVWVAATKRAPIAELADVAAAGGADTVSVMAMRAEGLAPIEVLGRRQGAVLRLGRWRFALVALLFAAIAAGLAAIAAQWMIGAGLSAEIDGLTASIAARRAALIRLERAGEDPAAQALDARKRSTPAAVVVLEALSRAIPDEAYLTEMRFEGDKVEIAGVAADAADLIHAIEKSPHFAEATFTAPTTRSADDKGELFRIEARVAPLLTVTR